jgi:hypothetical protein
MVMPRAKRQDIWLDKNSFLPRQVIAEFLIGIEKVVISKINCSNIMKNILLTCLFSRESAWVNSISSNYHYDTLFFWLFFRTNTVSWRSFVNNLETYYFVTERFFFRIKFSERCFHKYSVGQKSLYRMFLISLFVELYSLIILVKAKFKFYQ